MSSWTVVFTLTITIISLLYYWSVSNYRFWKNKKVRYLKPIPLFGNLWPFVSHRENYHQFLQRVYNSLKGKGKDNQFGFGGYFEMRNPVLMVMDPNLIVSITIKDFNHFYDRSIDFIFRPNKKLNPLSENLFTLKGEKWRALRQHLSPVFTTGKLNKMFDEVRRSVSNVETILNSTHTTEFEIRGLFITYMLDAIGSCAFSLNCSSLDESSKKFQQLAEKAFLDNPFALRFFLLTINQKLLDIFQVPDISKDFTNYFLSIIFNAINYRDEHNVERKDFLQVLINILKNKSLKYSSDTSKSCINFENDHFDKLDVAANAFIFFTGGFETTATILSYVLYEVALHDEVQQKLRLETDIVKKKHGGDITVEALKELNYMEMVISETLRLYPPISSLFRLCTKDYTIPGTDIHIESGTKVIIPIEAVHKDPDNFANPTKFDPERFSSDNKSNIRNGTYFPFGDGPRMCIGMRFANMIMKMILAEIVSKYEVKPYDRTEIPLILQKGIASLIPTNGMWLKIDKRTDHI